MFIQRIARTDIKKSRVPGVRDIIEAKRKKISDDLIFSLEQEIQPEYYNWAIKLLGDNDPAELLAAVLNYCFEEDLNPDAYSEIKDIRVPEKQLDQQGTTRLFVALGKKDKITARKLVDLITGKVRIKSRQIGDIQVLDNFSFITVPFDKAEQIVQNFRDGVRKPLITHARKEKKREKK
jgi:ATP-dependent RNA helicase DeaD